MRFLKKIMMYFFEVTFIFCIYISYMGMRIQNEYYPIKVTRLGTRKFSTFKLVNVENFYRFKLKLAKNFTAYQNFVRFFSAHLIELNYLN